VTWTGLSAFPYDAEWVLRRAPEASGVYALIAFDKWVYIGFSRNLRRALLQHLGTQDAIALYRPATVALQHVPHERLASTAAALIATFRPICNDAPAAKPRKRPSAALPNAESAPVKKPTV
jgi:hypothetical protein